MGFYYMFFRDFRVSIVNVMMNQHVWSVTRSMVHVLIVHAVVMLVGMVRIVHVRNLLQCVGRFPVMRYAPITGHVSVTNANVGPDM